jgi:hypothetical protein
MNEKERFDAFIRLAEFWLARRANRHQVLSRFTVSLWAAMVAGVAYLKNRPVEWEFVLLLVALIFGHFVIVRLAQYRNDADMQRALGYVGQGANLLPVPDGAITTVLPKANFGPWIKLFDEKPYLSLMTWVGPTVLLAFVAYLFVGQQHSN